MGLTPDSIRRVQFMLLAFLLFTSPYNMPAFVLSSFSILLFLSLFLDRKREYKAIFREKELMVLFAFILFTYLSILWTTGDSFFDGDFKTNFGRFKYYFFLIPVVYFAGFSLRELRYLLYIVVIAPIGIIAVYYLNALGITQTYSYQIGGDNTFLSHYLVTSTFILFSSTFLYIKVYESLRQKAYKDSLLYAMAFVIVSASLFVDARNEARLVNIAFLVILIAVPMYFISRRLKLLVFLLAITLIPLYLLNSEKLRQGYEGFSKAVEEDKYVGSWGHRTGYLIVGWKIFVEHPIFGRGIIDISDAIEAVKQSEPKYFRGENLLRLHNGHLDFLVQIGIIGYLFLLYVFYLLFRIRIEDHAINTFKDMFLLSFLVLMMGEHYLSVKHTTNLFAIMTGIWVVYRKLEQNTSTSPAEATTVHSEQR